LTHNTKSKENGDGRRENVCHPPIRPQNSLGVEDDGT